MQALSFPVCVVFSGGCACSRWVLVRPFFKHLGLGRDLSGALPKGMALLLVEVEGIFPAHPGFSSLSALPSGMSTSAGFLIGGSCGAGHSGVTAEMALAHRGPVFCLLFN